MESLHTDSVAYGIYGVLLCNNSSLILFSVASLLNCIKMQVQYLSGVKCWKEIQLFNGVYGCPILISFNFPLRIPY